MPEPGEPLYRALVKDVWPNLREDSEEFSRLKDIIHQRLPQIRQTAQQVRPYADRAVQPSKWLPSFKLLADLGCAAFSGLPWLILVMMIPIFMAFMGSFCEAYAFAERAAKWCNRKAAQGFQGILELLKYALGLRKTLPETAALEPLKIILEEFGVVDGPCYTYEKELSIGSAHYTATFLDKGVRLKLVSMTYSLIVLSMCICAIPAIAALRAGCNFGEQSTSRCINGAPQALSPDEHRVGDNLVNRDATAECNKVTDGLEHLVYRDPHDGPVAAFRLRRCIGTNNADFSPLGIMPPDWKEKDSIWVYVFGEDKEAFDADFADKYERLSGTYLNGKPSGQGRQMLGHYRDRDGCCGSWMGGPFCMAIWNPSGSYDASGRFGGERRADGWVLNIGRQLFGHPRERLVCRRANLVQTAFYANAAWRRELHGGARDYALHDQTKRDERDQIQDLGQYGFYAKALFIYYLGSRLIVAIEGLDNERVRAAVTGRSVAGVRSLMAPVCSAIVAGVRDLKSDLAAARRSDGTWRDVVRVVRQELRTHSLRLLAQLPEDDFQRAIALEKLDADVARAVARARHPTLFMPPLPVSGVAPVQGQLTGGVPRDASAPTVLPPLSAASPLDKGMQDMDTALPSSSSPMKLPSPDRKKTKGNAPGPL
jgi:hypothetical protein